MDLEVQTRRWIEEEQTKPAIRPGYRSRPASDSGSGTALERRHPALLDEQRGGGGRLDRHRSRLADGGELSEAGGAAPAGIFLRRARVALLCTACRHARRCIASLVSDPVVAERSPGAVSVGKAGSAMARAGAESAQLGRWLQEECPDATGTTSLCPEAFD